MRQQILNMISDKAFSLVLIGLGIVCYLAHLPAEVGSAVIGAGLLSWQHTEKPPSDQG